MSVVVSMYQSHSCLDFLLLIIHGPRGCLNCLLFPLMLRVDSNAVFHARHDFGPGCGCLGQACFDRGLLHVLGFGDPPSDVSVRCVPSAVVMSASVVAWR
jgi:hypothetical protein